MPLDKETLDALTKALSEGVNESMRESMDKFSRSQADSLRDGLDDIRITMLKAQDAFEVKTDSKIDSLGEAMFKRQDVSDQENAAKFADLNMQLSTFNEALSQKAPSPALYSRIHTAQQESQHPLSTVILPAPTSIIQPQDNPGDIYKIKEIVSNARTILGIGLISANHLESAKEAGHTDLLHAAALDFLRNVIRIKEVEVPEEDILKIFPAIDPKLERVYVQLKLAEQAELCMNVTRSLNKPELNVVLYIPKQMQHRFKALKNEEYRLRKHTVPLPKTRVEYTEEDIILLASPVGYFRYEHNSVHGLPPFNLAPTRTPPRGRKLKSKRGRSDSHSPNDVLKKKERIGEEQKTNDSGPRNVEKGSSGQQSYGDLN